MVSSFLSEEETSKANEHPEMTGWVIERAETKISQLTAEAEQHALQITAMKETVSMESPVGELTAQLSQSEETRRSLENSLAEMKRNIETATERLHAAEELARFRQDQMDSLKNELDNLAKRNISLNDRVNEVEERNHVIESNSQQAGFKILERKCESQLKEIEWSRSTLQERTDELVDMRKLHSKQVIELECDVNQLKEKTAVLERERRTASEEARRWENSYREESSRASRFKSDLAETIVSYDAQIEAHEKVVKAYKLELESNTSRISDLAEHVNSLESSKVESQIQFESENEKLRVEYNEELDQLKVVMEEKLKEIESNHQQEVQQLLKRPDQKEDEADLKQRGFTLTGLYDSFANERELRKLDSEEITALKTKLNHILTVLQKTQPEISRQRQDYEQALECFYDGQDKLAELMESHNHLHTAYRNIEKERDTFREEKEEESRIARDLARQVQACLSALHGSKGKPPISSPMKPSTALVSADDVISENLVTFSSIEELQANNQRLLTVVRTLSKKQESDEEVLHTKQIHKLKSELGEVIESRHRQEAMVKQVIQQRDMYRTLLAQADSKHSDKNDSCPIRAIADVSSPEPVSTLSQEYAQFRADTLLDIKQLQAKLDEQRESLSLARQETSTAQVESGYQKKRCDELNLQLKRTREESKQANEDKRRGFDDFLKLQKLLADQQNDLQAINAERESWSREKVRMEQIAEMLKQEVAKLTAVNTELVSQRDSQRTVIKDLMEGVNSMTAERTYSLKRLEEENKRLLVLEQDLKKELREARQQLVQTEFRLTTQVGELNIKYENVFSQSQADGAALAQANSELKSASEKEIILREQLDKERKTASQVRALRMSLGKSDIQLPSTTVPADDGERIQLLQSQLESKAKDVEAYHAISKSNEEALQKLSKSSEESIVEKENRIESLKKEKALLSAKLANASKSASEQRASIEERAKDLETQVNELESRARNAESSNAIALTTSQESVKDAEMFKKTAQTASDNYNRELQLHAAAASEASELRSKMSTIQKERQEALSELQLLQKSLEASEKSWSEERNSLEKQISQASVQHIDLVRQNELLGEQSRNLAAQMKMLQEQRISSVVVADDDDAMSNAKAEIARLNELLQITQRQRDVVILEKEEMELQLARTKQQLDWATKEMESIKEQYQRQVERTGGENAVIPASEHKRLLGSIQENIVLRNMNARLSADISELRISFEEKQKLLDAADAKLVPAADSERKLQAEIMALKADHKSLTEESLMFRERYDKLLERFGDKIDPAEHQQVVAEVAELTNKVESIQASETLKHDSLKKSSDEKVRKMRELGIKYRDEAKTKSQQIVTLKSTITSLEEAAAANSVNEESKSVDKLAAIQATVEELQASLSKKDEQLARFRKRIKEMNDAKTTKEQPAKKIENEEVDEDIEKTKKRPLNPDAPAFMTEEKSSESVTKKSKVEPDEKKEDLPPASAVGKQKKLEELAPTSAAVGKQKKLEEMRQKLAAAKALKEKKQQEIEAKKAAKESEVHSSPIVSKSKPPVVADIEKSELEKIAIRAKRFASPEEGEPESKPETESEPELKPESKVEEKKAEESSVFSKSTFGSPVKPAFSFGGDKSASGPAAFATSSFSNPAFASGFGTTSSFGSFGGFGDSKPATPFGGAGWKSSFGAAVSTTEPSSQDEKPKPEEKKQEEDL